MKTLYLVPDPGVPPLVVEVPDDIGPNIAIAADCPCVPPLPIKYIDYDAGVFSCAASDHRLPNRWFHVGEVFAGPAVVAMGGPGRPIGYYPFRTAEHDTGDEDRR